jgi:hypothetical protein
MTFSISTLVSAPDSHIKLESEAGGLIWVEGWYQGRYGTFHVIIFLSHILHWLFSSIYFYIAEKIFELTKCENKSSREFFLLKFYFMLFFLVLWTYNLWDHCADTGSKIRDKYGNMRANTDICPEGK